MLVRIQPPLSSQSVQILTFTITCTSSALTISRCLQRQTFNAPGSFGGVVPIALTNIQATADEATHGAPVTGPGIAEPFPPDAQDAAKPSPSAAMDTAEQASQVSAVMMVTRMVCMSGCFLLLWQLVQGACTYSFILLLRQLLSF